jgi:hypothetical protein
MGGDNAETEGNADGCFTGLLGNGVFGPRPVLNVPLLEVKRLRCIAAVLLEISNREVITMRNPTTDHRHGWDALNRDTKGWCRSLLTCEAAPDMLESELRELVLAKSLVGKLVNGGYSGPAGKGSVLSDGDRDPIVIEPIDS